MQRIYIILKEDIVGFPPILSIIRILANKGCKVFHLGTYSDDVGRTGLEQLGVTFVPMPKYDGTANLVSKLKSQLSFRRKVEQYLANANIGNKDLIWIVQSETIYLLHNLAFKYPAVLHPLEFTNPVVDWKYRMISPTLDLEKTFKAAKAVVCCEYNRAHMTKGLFGLDRLPFVLPNKPVIDDNALDNVPEDISYLLVDYKEKVRDKKVILYQGLFLDRERRLEEFCEAIEQLPQDFVLVAMGRGSEVYDRLRKQYESDRIIFMPFIRPPFHLMVTKDAYIGVLSYFPRKDNIQTVINPLYCAPNKIYEYSKFGKPMVSNDIPGLHYIFKEHNCGICIPYPITPDSIRKAILDIDNSYTSFANGASVFYNSEKIEDIVYHIISNI